MYMFFFPFVKNNPFLSIYCYHFLSNLVLPSRIHFNTMSTYSNNKLLFWPLILMEGGKGKVVFYL